MKTLQGNSRIRRWLWCLAGLLVLLPSLAAPAESPLPPAADAEGDCLEDIDLLELDVETVVTGLRRRQDVRELPYAASVITAEDIRRSGARSIPDALRLVPGVDVADLAYGFSSVGVRGFYTTQSTQSLVLVDGRQISDPILGGTYWGCWPFQLEDIERIEVIRGPAGVTWGANATNGMINIVTKDPADQTGLTTYARGGSRGQNIEHLGYGFVDGKLRMRVSGEYEGSDGFAKGGSFLRKLDDDYKSGRFGLYGVYTKNPRDTITVSAGSAVTDGVFPQSLAHGFFGLHNPGAQANYVMSRWDHKLDSDSAYSVSGYVNDYRTNLGGDAYDLQYHQFALQFNHTFKPAESHRLIWGLDTRADLVDGSNADPHFLDQNRVNSGTIGLYVEDEWRFAPKWALNTGARIDYESYTGFQPSARLALSYEPQKDALIYGAVSRAFKSATPGLRFIDMQILDGLMAMQSDRDMDVLSEIAYELGYRKKYFDRLDTQINLYWNECRDAAGFVNKLGLPDHLLVTNLQDASNYSLYGVEMEARYAVTRKLTLLGHYTFQFMDWRSSDAPDFSLALNSVSPPRHKFMIGPRYDLTDNIHLSSQLYYVDNARAPNPALPFVSKAIDSYFRWDLRAEYEFWKKRAWIAVGVQNLIDPGHYEGADKFYNDAQVPRMVYIEMRATFK